MSVEHALRQSSSDFVTRALSGWALIWLADHKEAIDCLQKAFVLGGRSPWALSIRGGYALACLQDGQYDRAFDLCNEGLTISSGYGTLHRVLAAAYALTDRKEAAADAVEHSLRLQPQDSIAGIAAHNVFSLTGAQNNYLNGLLLAGMREKPKLN